MKFMLKKRKIFLIGATLLAFAFCPMPGFAQSVADNLGTGNSEVYASEATTLSEIPSGSSEDYTLLFVEENSDAETFQTTYTGEAITPTVKLMYQQQEISPDLYTLTYENNTDAGEAAVKAAFVYEEDAVTVSASFSIEATSISEGNISVEQETYNYDAEAKEPEVTLSVGETVLVKEKDYTLSYENNIRIGTATITVTGTGNYTGVKTAAFKIQLKTPSIKTKCTYGVNKIAHGKVAGATGYQVARSKNVSSGYKVIKTVSGEKAGIITNAVAFQSTYYYKVRAYAKVDGKTFFSKWTDAKKVTNTLEKGTVYAADRMRATWTCIYFEPVSGARGYMVYKSTKENGTYKKIATVVPTTKWNYLDKNTKAGTHYYYKVRAYKKVNGKVYYGPLSDPFMSETWTESKLYYLFPDGVPTSASQMSKYLTTVRVPMVDAAGNKTYKSLTVHKKLATEIKGAFEDMAAAGIPVRKKDTGSYCWRMMTSGGMQSHHSYGAVIDLNWTSNPFVKMGRNAYSAGYRPGKDAYSVTEECVEIWKNHGFEWGGDWHTYKDYMHFTYTGH